MIDNGKPLNAVTMSELTPFSGKARAEATKPHCQDLIVGCVESRDAVENVTVAGWCYR